MSQTFSNLVPLTTHMLVLSASIFPIWNGSALSAGNTVYRGGPHSRCVIEAMYGASGSNTAKGYPDSILFTFVFDNLPDAAWWAHNVYFDRIPCCLSHVVSDVETWITDPNDMGKHAYASSGTISGWTIVPCGSVPDTLSD